MDGPFNIHIAKNNDLKVISVITGCQGRFFYPKTVILSRQPKIMMNRDYEIIENTPKYTGVKVPQFFLTD